MRKIDRFDKYMDFKGLNDNKVTNDLGLSVGTLGKSRKEGRDISARVIELILNYYFDLSRVWLLTGEGEMLKPNSETTDAKNISATPPGDYRYVPLIPVEAFAGPIAKLLSDGVSIDECRKIIAPVAGAEMAIPVSGDSMEPIIHDGAIIYIVRINDRAFIPWGNIMVLDTENGALVKEVFPSPTDAEAVQVRSINPKYPPYDVPKESIRGIYRVLGFSKYYTTL